MAVRPERLIPIVAIVATLGTAASAQTEKLLFLGTQIKADAGTYLVTKDVNVRAKPLTGSKRLGGRKQQTQSNEQLVRQSGNGKE